MKNVVRRYRHGTYVVDSLFKRTMPRGPVEAFQANTVEQLTELEAKDLCCNLMDCISKFEQLSGRMEQILEEYNFK